MIPYLVICYVLLLVGWFVYRSFRSNWSASARRRFLHIMILMSLALPLTWFLNTSIPQKIVQTSNMALTDYGIFDASCTAEALEAECSRLMLDDETFCDCDQVYLNNVVAYKSNIWLNQLISWQPFLLYLIALVVMFLISQHLYKIRAILKLKGSASIHSIEFGSTKLQLVHAPQSIGYSSFQLKDNYLIWPVKDSMKLKQTERAAILYHELSHIKQKNTWEQLGLSLFQLLWFAHPIFYRIKRELVLLSEFIADEYALRHSNLSKKDYAFLLVQIKEQQLLAGTQGFQKHFLQHRVQRILNQANTTHKGSLFLPVLVWLSVSTFITFQSKNQLEPKWNEWTAYEKATVEHSATGRNLFCGSCLTH